jgi:molybdopterin synthase catalytic subunit
MNKVKVLFFATFKDRAGTKEAEIEIPSETTVGAFKMLIGEHFPGLAITAGSILVAVNKQYAFDPEEIPQGAEIALFPPVSGGEDFPTIFSITKDEIDLNALLKQITRPSTGASAIFSGMVRGITTRGKQFQTDYLEYEAYQPMAENMMKQVADEIREKWPTIEGIAIVQRIGRLLPETPTVLIAVTAAHRDTGVFEAARYGIDRLKEIVPIWKKEVSVAGEEWIEGDYIPVPQDRDA